MLCSFHQKHILMLVQIEQDTIKLNSLRGKLVQQEKLYGLCLSHCLEISAHLHLQSEVRCMACQYCAFNYYIEL